MVKFIQKERYGYDDLCQIVSILRSKDGCPWDSVQTHQSIRRNLLEEAYEACEGIDLDDAALMQEEFGDVLLQVVFHTDIEQDRGRFTMTDVIDTVCKKLIYRHPHVFSGMKAEDWDWEEMKKQEKGTETQAQAMDSVARSLPALIRAEKVQKKAKKAGCVWQSPAQAAEAAKKALETYTATGSESALADALFCLTGTGVDCETLLHSRCEDVIQRFTAAEKSGAVPATPADLLHV